jgi:hypothetical protein
MASWELELDDILPLAIWLDGLKVPFFHAADGH